ncbi:hypothetical protein [Sorangium sp. So ce1024]|uniref:PD-(D/E)XK nuclease domain-containing protein n=1 Tax=Sorangium sp. So ce1024 TaxID=3133327 RepID=UPI003F0072EA
MTATTILLRDAEAALRLTAQAGDLSPLEAAFIAWLCAEPPPSTVADALAPPLRRYEHVALAAFAEAAGWDVDASKLDDGLHWLVAVALERAGMPAPVVTDGIAHLALGLAARKRSWLAEWHDRVLGVGSINVAPTWLTGGGAIVRGLAASCTAELRLALASRGVVASAAADGPALLEQLVHGDLPEDALHAQVVLAALRWVRRAAPVVLPGQATSATVTDLLRNVPRSLQQWPWEEKPKTKNSRAAKWHVDNEYHVQALLWTILAPIFPDLKREEYAAQIGPIQPRVDFGIPSLRLLVEAKFARDRSALKNVVNEIAQDASSYFTHAGAYDSLLVFVWDNEGHTQDHHLVISGLRQFNRVVDAVIVGRPGHMTDGALSAAAP